MEVNNTKGFASWHILIINAINFPGYSTTTFSVLHLSPSHSLIRYNPDGRCVVSIL
ncbi:MAG: hypothetical protein GX470_03360 [Lentimicrobium sp.]|nr:hypothetical protein [Lentimicrobium sp.]